MLAVIIFTFLLIYFIKDFYDAEIAKKTTDVQLVFDKNIESVMLMLDIIKDTRYELLKNNNKKSPVSINLTDFELIERVKNTLQHHGKLIYNEYTNLLISRSNLFLNTLADDLALTISDLTKLQINEEIDVENYLSAVTPSFNLLTQYKHIRKDEYRHHLELIESSEKDKSKIVLFIIIVAMALAFYVVFKLLKIILGLIHEKNKADEELQHYQDELENRVANRTSDLNASLKELELKNKETVKSKSLLIKAKHEADHANQQKSDFLSRMSHELRTPMNAILGFAQLLEMEISNNDQIGYVSEILTAGKHLEEMIDEVLNLSKIESGNIDIKLTSVPLLEIVEESIALVIHLSNAKGIAIINNLTDDKNCTVLADSLRLKEVVLNMLTNAIKYNVQDGSITINRKIENNIVTVSVLDTGIGIADSEQSDVFEPFNRMGAEFTSVEGSGIGLSIAKTLIELMNGSIGFNSVAGKGTEFWITLQKVSPAQLDDTKVLNHDAVVSANKQYKLVYIEDNNANLRLVEGIIRKQHNITLFSHDNAEEGLLLIRREMPDLIILDINLPGMSGFDALAILKQDDTLKHIPVYALSASATAQNIEDGLVAGFERYLIKPIQVKNFISVINAELNNAATNGVVDG